MFCFLLFDFFNFQFTLILVIQQRLYYNTTYLSAYKLPILDILQPQGMFINLAYKLTN